MLMGRDQIAALIPHQGNMVLLDAVTECDDDRICCTTSSHRHTAHPLAVDGELPMLAGIEYGAQAMAIHGGLLAQRSGAPRPQLGLLVAVRDLRWNGQRLDQLPAPLQVTASRVAGDDSRVVYDFAVGNEEAAPCLQGRATVVLRMEQI